MPGDSSTRDGFELRFWGVRGSVPTPGARTSGVGGNTSCVELRAGEHRIILDGGTGLRPLGDQLVEEVPEGYLAHVFFSHMHWDHIQGLPFFAPAFVPSNTLHLYAGVRHGRTLRQALEGQMVSPYFPVPFDRIDAALHVRDLAVREEVHLDSVTRVFGLEGNHPDGVFAWRVEHKGHSVVYATDTECTPEHDAALVSLARGADVFVFDAQYTPEEYNGSPGRPGKHGWGHSTMLDGARIAHAAKVGTYVLFHHDPSQDDAAVAAKETRARERFERAVAAREGDSLDVTRGFEKP